MENVKVIDNFLDNYHFELLESFLMGENIPWYYMNGLVRPGDGGYQLTHAFITFEMSQEGSPDIHYPIVEPCVRKLGANKMHRIKANLTRKTIFPRPCEWHIDIGHPPPNLKTAIFYANTCNGYTKFRKGGKVKSVANRMVIFPGHMEHSGVSCTDKDRRLVVNFNYE